MSASEQMIHRTAVMTGNQYDLVGHADTPLCQQSEDRRAVAVGHWMQNDASTASAYLQDEITTAFVAKLGEDIKCGNYDDAELGRIFKRLILGPGMCNALDACRCDDYQKCPIHGSEA